MKVEFKEDIFTRSKKKYPVVVHNGIGKMLKTKKEATQYINSLCEEIIKQITNDKLTCLEEIEKFYNKNIKEDKDTKDI